MDAWLEAHPAYEDQLRAEGGHHYLYRITRHHYGTPPEGFIQEDKALHMAVMHAMTLRPDVTFDQLMNRCHHILYYDVCDPDHPLWRVVLSWDADRALPSDPIVNFFMVIDPESGRFIADQRTLSLADANQW